MKWIVLFWMCSLCKTVLHNRMFLASGSRKVDKDIEVIDKGDSFLVREDYLDLFMDIVNGKENDCYEVSDSIRNETQIHCRNIMDIENVVFKFKEREVVLIKEKLLSYNEELSLYVMNIIFCGNEHLNRSVISEELFITYDNVDVTSYKETLLLASFDVSFFMIFLYIFVGIVILIIIAVVIDRLNTYYNDIVLVSPFENPVQFTPLFQATSIVGASNFKFPYEPQHLHLPQALQKVMFNSFSVQEFVVFPQETVNKFNQYVV